MKKLTLNVADHKLATFLSFIQDLNYVEVVSSPSDQTAKPVSEKASPTQTDDFMSLAGMWEGQDVSAEKIRAKAWPTRQ